MELYLSSDDRELFGKMSIWATMLDVTSTMTGGQLATLIFYASGE
jgi:hypothetical protein